VIWTDSAQATLIPDVSDAGKIIEAYYDPARKCYWIPNSREGWVEINETSLRRHLRGYGLRNKAMEGERLSQVEQKLNEIQYEQDVVYAGPLAGYRSGLIECVGNRVLVTSSPKLILPAEGDWTIIDTLLRNLLVDDVYDQRPYLYGWLKVAYEALRCGVWRPGQAMGLAGPRDCGKISPPKLNHLNSRRTLGETLPLYDWSNGVQRRPLWGGASDFDKQKNR